MSKPEDLVPLLRGELPMLKRTEPWPKVEFPTPRCTCHPVPERYHTTHYGATEPGSTLEPDYDCPVHFPARDLAESKSSAENLDSSGVNVSPVAERGAWLEEVRGRLHHEPCCPHHSLELGHCTDCHDTGCAHLPYVVEGQASEDMQAMLRALEAVEALADDMDNLTGGDLVANGWAREIRAAIDHARATP